MRSMLCSVQTEVGPTQAGCSGTSLQVPLSPSLFRLHPVRRSKLLGTHTASACVVYRVIQTDRQTVIIGTGPATPTTFSRAALLLAAHVPEGPRAGKALSPHNHKRVCVPRGACVAGLWCTPDKFFYQVEHPTSCCWRRCAFGKSLGAIAAGGLGTCRTMSGSVTRRGLAFHYFTISPHFPAPLTLVPT